MIELKIFDEERNWVYRLGDRGKISVGRAPTNDIQIRETRSSRIHCQIETVPGGYKLVDLESRNGTRVNDDVVNSRVLNPGDRIQIGSTVIQFGAASVPEAVTSPAPAVSEPHPVPSPAMDDDSESEERPVQTVRIDKRPSHRAIVPPRKSTVPWEILVIGGGVLLALVVGTLIYNAVQASSERTQLLKSAESSWAMVEREMDLPPRIARMKEAIDKFEKVDNLFPDSAEGAKARARIKEIKPRYAGLKKWAERYKAVVQSRKLAGDLPTMDQLIGWEETLRKIEDDCPFGSLSAQAGLERQTLGREVSEAAKRLIDEQRKEMEIILAGENYTGALMRWELFRENYSRYPDLVKDVESEIAQVKEKVETSFKVLSSRVDRLIDENRLTEAKALLERSREKYVGTDVAAKVAMKAQVITLVSRGSKKDRGQAEQVVKAREKIYLSAAEAEKHARRREFDKAITVYRDILADSSEPEVQEEFSRRVKELTAIRDLFTDFIARASGSLKGTEWNMGKGAVVKIKGADRDRVYFSLANSQGSTSQPWRGFRPEGLIRLFMLTATTGEGRFTLATFAYRNNLMDEGEKLLAEALAKDSGLQDRIDATLSRVRGEPVPDGGYVLYKSRWYSRTDRDRAVEDDKIASLVQVILQKPLPQAAGAMGTLSTMKRGRQPMLKALYEKREILKKKMAKDLRFDNAVLVQLKRQIDEARAEALDFIEDVARYPDKKKMEAEGRSGEYWKIQKEEVDTRVKAVRDIWVNPYSAAVKMNPAARSIEKDLRKVNEWIAREDKKFDPKKADEVDTSYIASLASSKLNIKTFSTDKKEQKLIAYNIAVMEWNKGSKEATQVEIEQVRVTNEYRWMLGRRCVKIEDMLVRAARGHSKYMTDSGKFAHVIPGEPEGATPRERCKYHGYTAGSTSENISYNQTDPTGTFVAWYNSSGHHRNMINRNWAVLGAGLSGPNWTQNFGSSDSTKGTRNSPGGGGWGGTDWRGGRAKRKK
ncbi:MAG: FHA domain-containing protein [Planctomycetota bacterium]|jgi:uncharacterized protein YkwD